MITNSANEMLPSTQRPIPLQGRDDLVAEVIDYRGVNYWVIKDPVGLEYHRLQPEQYHVLRLLNGERNLEQIREELLKEFPTLGLNLSHIQNLITDLHEKKLVYSDRPGQATTLIKKKWKKRKDKILGIFRSLLFLRLPGWDPEVTLQWMYPYFRWIYQPWAVAIAVITVLSAWTLLLVQFDDFSSKLPEFHQFFGWPNLIYLWFTLAIAKVIHEFGHGLTCTHHGGECHEMGVMLLVFSPCLYCDVTDSWMMKNKWHRIAIAAAGMYIEVVMSALAIFIWWNTQPGILHHLCLNFFFVTTISTVIFNANPLLRFDGYYMMADWLEIPNLRAKSDKLVRDTFAWWCLGIEPAEDPFMPETGRVWFVTYAIAASLYRWVILFSITMFLYTVLKPYGLQSVGIMLAVVSVGGIIVSSLINIYKIVSAPRIEPMSKLKIGVSLTLVSAVVAGVMMVPIPWHLESAFLIEPNDVQHVYVTMPGEIQKLKVQPGQPVQPGQVLAQLANPQLDDARLTLKSQLKVQQAEEESYNMLDSPSEAYIAGIRIKGTKAQLAETDKQQQQLKIVAPIAGKVIAPPRKPEPKLDPAIRNLTTWHGTPLDPKNKGCFVEERTHLLSIAPDERWQAVLLIDQGDRNDLTIGEEMELKFEHLPHRTYKAKVKEISQRHLEFAPDSLSNKHGGALPTVTDAQGRERLASVAYQATVLLEEDADMVMSGMRGRARFLVDERSAGQWLWRWFRRTFHFRL